MGEHYVPQKYLSAFASVEDRRKIWMFDKKSMQWTLAAISKVAQQRGFYGTAVEKELADRIERPGNRALERLRKGERLSEQEKRDASLYLATMLNRVPKRRGITTQLVQPALEQVLAELQTALDAREADGNDSEKLAARRREFEEVAAKVRAEPMSPGVEEVIRSPFPSQNVLTAIDQMTWIVAHVTCADRFITSDNPLNSFGHLGLGRRDSEIVFPLSPDTCLFGIWAGVRGQIIDLNVASAPVKEANRRVVHWAERFVFSSRKEDWVEVVARKTNPRFNLIRWNVVPSG